MPSTAARGSRSAAPPWTQSGPPPRRRAHSSSSAAASTRERLARTAPLPPAGRHRCCSRSTRCWAGSRNERTSASLPSSMRDGREAASPGAATTSLRSVSTSMNLAVLRDPSVVARPRGLHSRLGSSLRLSTSDLSPSRLSRLLCPSASGSVCVSTLSLPLRPLIDVVTHIRRLGSLGTRRRSRAMFTSFGCSVHSQVFKRPTLSRKRTHYPGASRLTMRKSRRSRRCL
mmetsp:Transcript_28772/g.87122  ORF Transcript_28772/g.87122 Transcript_28772/m.87122 type:complete len:229 (-) Transcript_28772:1014-1700(-)